jgi:hypothetical protein
MSKFIDGLWLDDVRDPEKCAPNLPNGQWTWAKNYAEFVEVVKSASDIYHVSLDHDLGGEINFHSETEPFGKTGLHCAREMFRLGKFPRVITVHSWNPDGSKAIKNLVKDTNRYQYPHSEGHFNLIQDEALFKELGLDEPPMRVKSPAYND